MYECRGAAEGRQGLTLQSFRECFPCFESCTPTLLTSDDFALPLEISAKIIREHLSDGSIARRLITEGLQGEQTGPDGNDYVLNLRGRV